HGKAACGARGGAGQRGKPDCHHYPLPSRDRRGRIADGLRWWSVAQAEADRNRGAIPAIVHHRNLKTPPREGGGPFSAIDDGQSSLCRSTPLVSLTKIMPITKVMEAMMIGYQRP